MIKQSHNFDHSHKHDSISLKNITFTLFLNLFFAILEMVAFFFTNSMTMYSSAIHDFGDVIILFFSVLIEKISTKPRSEKYTYGYRRFTLIAAIINAVVLLGSSIYIIINAIERLINPEPIAASVVLIMAGIGVIVNIVGIQKLKQDDSVLNRALVLNLKADVYNFIAIIISSSLIIAFNLVIFDAIFAIFIALKMLREVNKEIKTIFAMLMQAIPDDIELKDIEEKIMLYEMVQGIEDLHIWNLDGEDYIMSFNLLVDTKNYDINEIINCKDEIKISLEEYKINHTTIEIKSYN